MNAPATMEPNEPVRLASNTPDTPPNSNRDNPDFAIDHETNHPYANFTIENSGTQDESGRIIKEQFTVTGETGPRLSPESSLRIRSEMQRLAQRELLFGVPISPSDYQVIGLFATTTVNRINEQGQSRVVRNSEIFVPLGRGPVPLIEPPLPRQPGIIYTADIKYRGAVIDNLGYLRYINLPAGHCNLVLHAGFHEGYDHQGILPGQTPDSLKVAGSAANTPVGVKKLESDQAPNENKHLAETVLRKLRSQSTGDAPGLGRSR